jgi:hypothetical protein
VCLVCTSGFGGKAADVEGTLDAPGDAGFVSCRFTTGWVGEGFAAKEYQRHAQFPVWLEV